ncbi:transcriptional regulator [Longispora fulva]|uniref:Transcriptional regulator with XRE-family HTH domain n=1 Tax=Longispora fulva TaxID=619741 RepID=A0A8J7KNT8_9ACTN|nr:helix-turn-helix transcriptional regulator [Longispora fulva]MBG6140616.1 transcriptional regulator with XRE-family HTH domain [Longispora fulva]GIG57002.1 transcriptional regulator [Longispora fulva]
MDQSVGARLRALRLTRGLTQRQLAEPHYTRAYLSMVEADRVPASEDLLAYLAGRLQITIGEITGDATRFDGLRRAGETQLLLGGYAEAARLFAAAAELPVADRDTATCRQVTALALAGDTHAAVRHGEALVADRPGPRAYAALVMPYTILGASRRVADAAAHALDTLPPDAPDELRIFVYRAVTHSFIGQHRFPEAARYAHRALALCAPDSPDAGLCRLSLASARMEALDWAPAADELRLAVAALTGTSYQLQARTMLAEALHHLGDATGALAALPEPGELAGWLLGYAYRIRGLLGPDEAALRSSMDVFEALGAARELVESGRCLGRLLAAEGRLAESVAAYQRGLAATTPPTHA